MSKLRKKRDNLIEPPDYDTSKFKLNKRRKNDLLAVAEQVYENGIDIEDHKLAESDKADVLHILECFEHNQVEAAIKAYRNLDTAIRDMCPQWLSELSGASINPFYFKWENSLVATE